MAEPLSILDDYFPVFYIIVDIFDRLYIDTICRVDNSSAGQVEIDDFAHLFLQGGFCGIYGPCRREFQARSYSLCHGVSRGIAERDTQVVQGVVLRD